MANIKKKKLLKLLRKARDNGKTISEIADGIAHNKYQVVVKGEAYSVSLKQVIYLWHNELDDKGGYEL